MFIQTEDTPNPATLKFLPGRDVTGGPAHDFETADAARGASLLAAALFEVDGVERVFLGDDFVSVSKADAIDWRHLKPGVLAVIMDHFTAGLPVLTEEGANAADSGGDAGEYEGEDAEIVSTIQELIDTRVRPAVAQDGGDIVFQRYDPQSGVVTLHMRGACAGCPSSTMTLKAGIENLLKHYVPQVTGVEAAL